MEARNRGSAGASDLGTLLSAVTPQPCRSSAFRDRRSPRRVRARTAARS
jgi:hypothetical protein